MRGTMAVNVLYFNLLAGIGGKQMQNEASLWKRIKPKKIHLRHYFGGLALILLLIQLFSGLYMIFYYEPSLKETYKTVQYFNNEAFLGAFTRNIHRYGAFFMGVAIFIHLFVGYFRKDYQGGRKINWITGVLLSILFVSFLISGTILPWEWKGYWMMEMFNNYLKNIPLIGDYLYNLMMTTYTPTRNFVIHDIVLPIITFVLLEIHCLTRFRARGMKDYFIRQTFASIPLIIAVIAMAVIYPVPSEDPGVLPLPMDGMYIPAPEWFFVSFELPYWFYPPRNWPMFLFWIPFFFLVLVFIIPYLFKRKKRGVVQDEPAKKMSRRINLAYMGVGGIMCVLLVVGLLWGSVKSPWMGCNSCHNVAMGDRMGIPPVSYKDTQRNPLLLDNRWMIRHWYEPQVIW